MKIKDVLAIRDKKKREFENLQKLEILLYNEDVDDLIEELAEKAGLDIPLSLLITEARMLYCDEINRMEKIINEQEIDIQF